MNISIDELELLRVQHQESGKRLLIITEGRLFPCHSLYLAILNRSLELLDGFVLLAKSNNYGCCMSLLRMQLDNILRFYGVMHTKDIHETANAIFNGVKLNTLKDSFGKRLRDGYLVDLLSKENPWVKNVYDLTSGYIHLSDQHYFHMLGRSNVEANGIREFYVGSKDEHVNSQHKIELVNAFSSVTNGIFKLLPELEKLSKKINLEELEERYAVYT